MRAVLAVFVAMVLLSLGGCITTDYDDLLERARARYYARMLVHKARPAILERHYGRRGFATRARRGREADTTLREPSPIAARRGDITYKPIPYADSPEALAEKAQNERRDREIEQRLRSICRGC